MIKMGINTYCTIDFTMLDLASNHLKSMAVYCISYDLISDNYDNLIDAIKDYGIWWHQSESTWFIETNQGARQIYDNLAIHLISRDKLIVIRVHRHWWAGGLTEDEINWMKQRQF